MGKKRKGNRRRRGASEVGSANGTEGTSDAEKVDAERTRNTASKTHHEAIPAVMQKNMQRKKKRNRKRKKASAVEVCPTKKQKLIDGDDKHKDSTVATLVLKSKKDDPLFPYPTEADDHCETPLEAYKDILPLLQKIAATKNDVCIYDPYYCDAAVTANLSELGFSNVYNEKEDCYQVWSNPDKCPAFDIFLTNPPYSGNHMERLMQHVTSTSIGDRPWFLLMPNWVHKRDFFTKATSNIRPFFVVPRKRYIYIPPRDYREAKKSDVHRKSSPWHSMWHVWGGSSVKNEQLIRAFYESSSAGHCYLAKSKSALRDLRRKKKT